MTDSPRDPQTLAEVRAGDTVTVFNRYGGPWFTRPVVKVTSKYIIFVDDLKFRADTGFGTVSSGWSRCYIALGPENAALIARHRARERRLHLEKSLSGFSHDPAGLAALRDACAAALKELGDG